MIGHIASDVNSSFPSDVTFINPLSPFEATSISLAFITSFNSSEFFLSRSSFFKRPAAVTILLQSVIHTFSPVTCAIESAYCFTISPTSSKSEYFFKITSPSFPVNISTGSASFIPSIVLISFGITILPKSSTRLTIPVAFIQSSIHYSIAYI